MSQNTTREVIVKMRERYGRRGREARSQLLDELCELCGYGNKHAIKLLGGKLPVAVEKGRRGGPRRRYGEAWRAVRHATGDAVAKSNPRGRRTLGLGASP